MAIIQNTQTGLRYLKRQNLEEEARIIGNYYRDIINSYGIDVNYHKLDTTCFENYTGIIDQNTILKHAYGANNTPDYSMSASMLSYMEVEQDIFQLNKIGLNPDATVNFYFDSNDFACALAENLGQYKEYKIKETDIICEVPDITQTITINNNGTEKTYFLSDDQFPYQLGLGAAENYYCDVLSGKLKTEIKKYDFDKEYTVVCDPYEHTLLSTAFSANPDLYKAFYHEYQNTKYLETLIYLTFKVQKIKVNQHEYKCLLKGKIHGGVLFYDLTQVGKYIKKIHPEVGDIITIDFPNEQNREQYEITDAFDKSLQTDGISPLLHKYIWKCKARRYVNSYEEIEQSDANEQLEEKLKYDQTIEAEVVNQISKYDDNQDSVYGGYGNVIEKYDREIVDPNKVYKYDFINDGSAIDIITFSCGTKLVTTGYELLYIDVDDNAYQLTTLSEKLPVRTAFAEKQLKYLKASKTSLAFTNIIGDSYQLIVDEDANNLAMEMHLEDMAEKTIDRDPINANGDNFYKFRNCKTYLFATNHHLYCHLESNDSLYKLI